MEHFEGLVAFLEAHRAAIVEDVKTLARIPSIAKAGEDGLPFGKASDDALVAAAQLFTKNGIPMTVRHEHGYAVAVLEGEGDGIGLFGHADVVPVNDDWKITAPFDPVEKDGIVYGRGVSDNKAGVIGALYALLALRAQGLTPRRRITVFVGGSEETGGMEDVKAFARNERQPAVCLIPDSDFPVSVGEKGILHVECRSRDTLKTVTRFDGGQAYNVVLDRVTVEIGGMTEVFEGLTSHAAHPEGSVNAAHKAAAALCEREDLDAGDRRILEGVRDTLADYYGEGIDMTSEGVFGKLTCVNGITRVEDGHLVFTLDIRYGNEFDCEAGLPRMLAALDKRGFDADVNYNSDGFLLDEGGEEMECILNAYRTAAQQPDAQPYKTYGGTYARQLKNAFAVDHSLPWDKKALGLPAGHGGAHQSDEALSVDALLGGIAGLAAAIHALDALCE